MVNISEFIEKVKSLTAPDIKVDGVIHSTLNPEVPFVCAYTRSVDAALSLLPEKEISEHVRNALKELDKDFNLHICFWPTGKPYTEWLARYIVVEALKFHLETNISSGAISSR